MDAEDFRTLKHFWDEKRDLTRMIGHEILLRDNPEIARAWNAYRDAEINLTRLLNTLADSETHEVG